MDPADCAGTAGRSGGSAVAPDGGEKQPGRAEPGAISGPERGPRRQEAGREKAGFAGIPVLYPAARRGQSAATGQIARGTGGRLPASPAAGSPGDGSRDGGDLSDPGRLVPRGG